MVLLRTILAVMIMFSLAATPVGVAFAGTATASTMAAMEHCDKKDMADCACCHKVIPCQFDSSCATKCVKIFGALSCSTAPAMLGSNDYPHPADAALIALSWPPPSPPPRR